MKSPLVWTVSLAPEASVVSVPSVMSDLAGQILLLQAAGDYAGTEEFLERYGEMTPEMIGALDRLDGVVPVDIRPTYEVTEMMKSW